MGDQWAPFWGIETWKTKAKASIFACSDRQLGQVRKNAKNWIKRFVKLTGDTYVYNDLVNFEYEAHPMTGTGNHMNCWKLPSKSREITSSEFWRIIANLNHCATDRPTENIFLDLWLWIIRCRRTRPKRRRLRLFFSSLKTQFWR